MINTEIFTIKKGEENSPEAIRAYERCGQLLREGKLVCFPTETVYGLGANALNPKAVENIFYAKGRPGDNPLIVHIPDLTGIDALSSATGKERDILFHIAEKFWPGPLTCITSKTKAVPDAVTCGLETVGIRIPSHPVARGLLKYAGVPVAAPSANISGKPSPTSAKHVIEDMYGKVDGIIDGGDCDFGVESTVIDLTAVPPIILRPGAITQNDLQTVLSRVDEYDWHIKESVDKPRSPGLKYKHYSPKAEVIMYAAPQGLDRVKSAEKVAETIKKQIVDKNNLNLKAGVLATDETVCYYKEVDSKQPLKIISLGSGRNSLEQASRLFRALREFDEAGVDIVYAEAVSEAGVGDAVMNRLYRAAGAKIEICT